MQSLAFGSLARPNPEILLDPGVSSAQGRRLLPTDHQSPITNHFLRPYFFILPSAFAAGFSPNRYSWKPLVQEPVDAKKSAPHFQRSAFVPRRGRASKLQQSPDRPRRSLAPYRQNHPRQPRPNSCPRRRSTCFRSTENGSPRMLVPVLVLERAPDSFLFTSGARPFTFVCPRTSVLVSGFACGLLGSWTCFFFPFAGAVVCVSFD